MGSVNRSQSFFKFKVDILRPTFAFDVTTIRDPIVSGYGVINTNVRAYIEPIHSSIVAERQVGSIEVATMVGFFNKNTNIQINDIIRENANAYNGQTAQYWKVIGKLNYSRYDFHIRVDLHVMNYQRGQGSVI